MGQQQSAPATTTTASLLIEDKKSESVSVPTLLNRLVAEGAYGIRIVNPDDEKDWWTIDLDGDSVSAVKRRTRLGVRRAVLTTVCTDEVHALQVSGTLARHVELSLPVLDFHVRIETRQGKVEEYLAGGARVRAGAERYGPYTIYEVSVLNGK